jgi:hypothetical protein
MLTRNTSTAFASTAFADSSFADTPLATPLQTDLVMGDRRSFSTSSSATQPSEFDLVGQIPNSRNEVAAQLEPFLGGTIASDGSSLNGLVGDYFVGLNNPELRLRRVDSGVNFTWGAQSPDPTISSSNFIVRWSGKLVPQYSETYTFFTNADERTNLLINGQNVIFDGAEDGITQNRGQITLQAGQVYDIVLETSQSSGRSQAQLSWSSTSQQTEVVPTTRLFTTNPSASQLEALTPIPGPTPPVLQPPGSPLPTPTSSRSAMGINLAGVSDLAVEWVFVDAFKMARPWNSIGGTGELALTPEGWVAYLEEGQTAETIIFSEDIKPIGQYTLLYEGDGDLGFGLSNTQIISREPGRIVVEVLNQSSPVIINLTRTNPDNPVRNIQMIMPGFESTYQTQPFHPLYLEYVSQFSTLRFMDWAETNNSRVSNWSERTKLTSATQTGKAGVAMEYMVALGNTVNRDIWVNVPHEATDDYVRQMATLIRDSLKPGLKVYIEYSNEVWNSTFEQYSYLEELGQTNYPTVVTPEDPFTGILYAYADRSVQVFKIFEEVFGGTERLQRVMANQFVGPENNDLLLGWNDAYRSTDIFAVAPYVYGGSIQEYEEFDRTRNLSVDQVIDAMYAEMRTSTRELMLKNSAVTQKYNIQLSAYEAGQHLTTVQFPGEGDDPLKVQATNLFAEVNRSSRMRDLYTEYLNLWNSSGGGLMNHFYSVGPYNQYGFWGLKEYQTQDPNTAPKYLAVRDYIRQTTAPA